MEFRNLHCQEKSVPIGILSNLSNYLEQNGIDPWLLFEKFNIKQEDLYNNLHPLPEKTRGELYKAAKALTGCDHLGLMLGQKASLENIGPLQFLVLNSGTMREALQSLFQYCSLWYKGLHCTLNENHNYAEVRVHVDQEIPEREQLQTAYLVAIVTNIGLILGKPWRPILVRIAYPKPKSAHLYEEFFNCPVWFGQSQHEILFPQKELDQARVGHNDKLKNYLRNHLAELQDNVNIDIKSQVCKIIEELLPHGSCSVEAVAAFFSIHRFTLYRYLNNYETTFESLLESTKKNMAINLLKNNDLLIMEISNQLNYENQANFTRAFKRWYGITPKTWRQRYLASNASSQAALQMRYDSFERFMIVN